jgi:hypothetical protein
MYKHIVHFIKNYEDEKDKLRIDEFNSKKRILSIAYREYVEKCIPIYTLNDFVNIKTTTFQLNLKFNEDFNKINDIEFINDFGKHFKIKEQDIKNNLIAKLEKDLKTISYKKSIKSLIDYNNFVKKSDLMKYNKQKYKVTDEEKLSLLREASSFLDQTQTERLSLL